MQQYLLLRIINKQKSMDRYPKKPKVADLLAKYSTYEIIPEPIAFVILSKAEVQDALTFTSSASGDLRFRVLLEVMGKDAIWKHWFERDLGIVFVKYNVPRLWDNIQLQEGPPWKVYYLWWRLIISAYQWEFLQNPTILNAYPLGSQVRHVKLNEMELITEEGAVMYLDFRREFLRMATTLQAFQPQFARDVRYSARWLWLLRGYQGTRFFHVKFPNTYGNFARDLELVYREMIRMFVDTDNNVFQLNRLDASGGTIFQRPPRIVEATSLIVSSCITCGVQAQCKEKMNHDNTFCGKTCQRRFYY